MGTSKSVIGGKSCALVQIGTGVSSLEVGRDGDGTGMCVLSVDVNDVGRVARNPIPPGLLYS